jgi:ribose transport system ATP-binding protein
VVVASEIWKTFGGTTALADVSIGVRAGEIHGLVGENGSGKSTLIKILAGYHAPDQGHLTVAGRPLELPADRVALRELGLSFVHQDLGLITPLTVLENLRIGARLERRQSLRPIRWARERRDAQRVFGKYGLDIDPTARIGDLAAVERALVAIVRALEDLNFGEERRHPSVLVLDEPTVFLPEADVHRLFALMRSVASHGSSVLFVSHDLDEVRSVTDRVTVLRDGRAQGTVETRSVTHERLVEMIIGRNLTQSVRSREADVVDRSIAAMEVRHLAGRRVVDLSLELASHEVLGVTGLVGSGFEEVPYLLFGASPAKGGEVVIGRRRLNAASISPPVMMRLGAVLIPGDRQRDGSAPVLTLRENLMLPVLDTYLANGVLQHRKLTVTARRLCAEYDVRPPDPAAQYSSLSGGNQQKALLAKWLQTIPSILLMHEPTQGVDIGARAQITRLIREAALRGTSVLVASSDYEQLEWMCDRVLVITRGRVDQELTGRALVKDRISEAVHASMAAASPEVQ